MVSVPESGRIPKNNYEHSGWTLNLLGGKGNPQRFARVIGVHPELIPVSENCQSSAGMMEP